MVKLLEFKWGGGTVDLEDIDWVKKHFPNNNYNGKVGEVYDIGVPLSSIRKLLNNAIK